MNTKRIAKQIFSHTDFSGKVLSGDGKLLKTRRYTGEDFFASAQGITNDGTYFYCTGTVAPLGYHGITKIDMATGRIVQAKYRYLPAELAALGFNHYGGCTYFEEKLFVAVEDTKREHPCLAVFDANTLEFTGRFQILGAAIQPNGNLPWCAADKENRLLYTGFFDHCNYINVFDVDTLEHKDRVFLDRTVEHTQGGEMWGGVIYISCHDSWREKHIYAIDPETGRVRTVMTRSAKMNLVESEGITVCPTPDGGFFHQLDVVYPLGLAIRTYSAPSETARK